MGTACGGQCILNPYRPNGKSFYNTVLNRKMRTDHGHEHPRNGKTLARGEGMAPSDEASWGWNVTFMVRLWFSLRTPAGRLTHAAQMAVLP